MQEHKVNQTQVTESFATVHALKPFHMPAGGNIQNLNLSVCDISISVFLGCNFSATVTLHQDHY